MKITKTLIVGLSLLTLGLTSCSKDFECHCHIDTVDGQHIDDEREIKDSSKSDAETECGSIETTLGAVETNEEVHCELK